MKKVFLGMAAMAMIFTSCNKDESESAQDQEKVDMSDFYVYTDADQDEASRMADNKDSKTCFTMVNLNRLLNENPGLYDKMYDIELKTRTSTAAKGKPGGGGGTDPAPPYTSAVTIPVVVNIIETSTGKVNHTTNRFTDSNFDSGF